MSYYTLPTICNNDKLKDSIIYEKSLPDNIKSNINKTLSTYLTQAKNQIDSKQCDWDKYKKFTNPYEYIHTVIPGTKSAICKYKPLSRSFFKMIETMKTMRLMDIFPKDSAKTYHFAEGPGGFIEAIAYLRENKKDNYFGMTLLDDSDCSVPGWKKSKTFLENNQNVIIERGITGDGDMLKADNLKECYKKHNNSCQLVTADGGFDFTNDFNHQEIMSLKLAYAQVAYALACQQRGGAFVIKVFDTFTPASIDLLYILANAYENVNFFKPNTSRSANSEKYIVCKNFRLVDSKSLVIAMFHVIQQFEGVEHPKRFLNCDIPYIFLNSIQEINACFGQSQIECISQTLQLINSCSSSRIDNLKKIHITKSINWCQKFRLPYNKVNISSNIFLSSRISSESQFSFKSSNTNEECDNEKKINDT
tara:strand:- start:3673 stop:4935 length:1263 start_codon:yes stop_codon:yes gene_type:complete